MIPIETALSIILEHIKTGPEETVPIAGCLGMVLAEDIRAGNDIPPFANSAMDGYAVRAADLREASALQPAVLTILEDIPAGRLPARALKPKTASRIMTGAPLPEGADAVIIVEETSEDNGTVYCKAPVSTGDNIRHPGEDVKNGEVILRRGMIMRPQEMGMCAALGRPEVRVIKSPRVAILATGSELVTPGDTPGPGEIRNCNNTSCAGLVMKYGAVPVDLGIARDDREELRKKLLAAAKHDIVCTSGGVSVGTHDLVKEVLAELGAEMKFWKVCMKPGKPLAFGMIHGTPVFGLPGNPVSVIVSFEMFVRPAILKMRGMKKLGKTRVTALLDERIEKTTDRVHLNRGILRFRNGAHRVIQTGEQGSGILQSLVRANCFIVLPKDTAVIEAGTPVEVIPLDTDAIFL